MTAPRLLRTGVWLLLAALGSCAVSETADRDGMLRDAELYASRAAFGWERLEVFQLRGNCRIDDRSLVARGRFVLWGSRDDALLRGDFYGPDGRAVVSMMADSSGMTLYLPGEERALFMPLGLVTGSAVLPTRDLIHLIRTGFPLVLEPWEMAEGASFSGGRVQWNLRTDSGDTLSVRLESGNLFPSACLWTGGSLRVTASSPHDEYDAWPWGWTTLLDGSTIELELTQVDTDAIPWAGIWSMAVPVPIDTLEAMPPWIPAWSIEQH